MEPGLTIQHYRLLRKLGEGGMGVVWEAEDVRLGRRVAIKFVSETWDRERESVDRHLREARAASALNHPSICSIFDLGEWRDRRFLVMELLEGRTVLEAIKDGPLPIEVGSEPGLADGRRAGGGASKGHRSS